jgi:flavin-binding protein dodecin
MCLGYKKGLVEGDEYLWFLAPVYGAGGSPGNAIVMEATRVNRDADAPAEAAEASGASPEGEEAPVTGGGEGKATYVFRIVSRGDYPGMSAEALDAATDKAIRRINDCMQAINFRREPIYLSDETLRQPANTHYLFSVQRLPELRELRALFVGRVIHASAEQWQKDLQAALKFNVEAKGDGARWAKGLKL